MLRLKKTGCKQFCFSIISTAWKQKKTR